MASLKLILFDQSDKNENYPLKFRLSHKGKTRYIDTSIKVKKTQFNGVEVIKHTNAKLINIQLRNRLNALDKKIIELGNVNNMEMDVLLNICRRVDGSENNDNFINYLETYIAELQAHNKKSYAEIFTNTKTLLTTLYGSIIQFKEITPHWLQQFEKKTSMPQYDGKGNKQAFTGLKNSTIHIHLRNIRTIYNVAIKDPATNVMLNDYPFLNYKLPKISTSHRNLQAAEVSKIIHYTHKNKTQQRAKDLFLLSFYLIGINFKDLLHAQKTDIINNRLIYTREKTKKEYSILIEPEAAAIINAYQGKHFLLNILEKKPKPGKERNTQVYKDITSQTNKQLKKIAKALHIESNISTYYARHSWATIARNIGISKDDIITALGHGQNSVTDIYINVDLSRVDAANRKVIDYVNKAMDF